MNQPNSALIPEIKHLLTQLQAAQSSFTSLSAKVDSLVKQWQSPEDPEVRDVAENPLEATTALEDPFEINPSLERVDDHYVELPFMDPYDCFDDSAPLDSFPEPPRIDNGGALEGLFQADPESEAPKPSNRDVEIEFLPDGGYRMRSHPGKRISKTAEEGVATETGDSIDGLTA